MAMNPYGVIKSFNIFKHKLIGMMIIKYFISVYPLPFQQSMKGFYAGIIPWIGFLRVTVDEPFCGILIGAIIILYDANATLNIKY